MCFTKIKNGIMRWWYNVCISFLIIEIIVAIVYAVITIKDNITGAKTDTESCSFKNKFMSFILGCMLFTNLFFSTPNYIYKYKVNKKNLEALERSERETSIKDVEIENEDKKIK